MKNFLLEIAGIQFNIESEINMTLSDVDSIFLKNKEETFSENGNLKISYKLFAKDFILPKDAKKIYENTILKIYESPSEDLYITRYTVKDPNVDTQIILVRGRRDTKVYEMYLTKEYAWYFTDKFGISAYMAIDEALVNAGGFMLHASLIDAHGVGILFTAPSGTGKSTQAKLWEENRGAKILNGDRVMIRPVKAGNDSPEVKYFAYGSMFAGSSHIYINESVEIGAIVILSQNKENMIVSTSESQQFVKIYSESLVKPWNVEYQEKVIEAIERVVNNVKIISLACTPDVKAVETLEDVI
jgi:hypothetical protein